jgi:molybdopterin converting factor small subunit
MITVRLPSTLGVNSTDTLEVHERVRSIGELIEVLDRRIPGFKEQLDDSVFNFAVNDEMLLHRTRDRALADGDVVEIIPTISGG